MKILVCLKQVPHKDARLELASDGKWIQDANIKFEINDYDNYALEEALRVKDKDAATEVVVICIGPDRVQQSLRTALGMGADRASRSGTTRSRAPTRWRPRRRSRRSRRPRSRTSC